MASTASAEIRRPSRNTPQEFFQETLEFFETDDEVVNVVKAPLLRDEFDVEDKDGNLMVLDEVQVSKKLFLQLFYEELDQLDDLQTQETENTVIERHHTGKTQERGIPTFQSDEEKPLHKKTVFKAKSLAPLILLVGLSGCGFLAHTMICNSSKTRYDLSSLSPMEGMVKEYSDPIGTNVEEELPDIVSERESCTANGTATSSPVDWHIISNNDHESAQYGSELGENDDEKQRTQHGEEKIYFEKTASSPADLPIISNNDHKLDQYEKEPGENDDEKQGTEHGEEGISFAKVTEVATSTVDTEDDTTQTISKYIASLSGNEEDSDNLKGNSKSVMDEDSEVPIKAENFVQIEDAEILDEEDDQGIIEEDINTSLVTEQPTLVVDTLSPETIHSDKDPKALDANDSNTDEDTKRIREGFPVKRRRNIFYAYRKCARRVLCSVRNIFGRVKAFLKFRRE